MIFILMSLFIQIPLIDMCIEGEEQLVCLPKSNSISALTGSSYITSPFGLRLHPLTSEMSLHTGIDIGAKRGTPIFAIAKGTVVETKRHKYYGRMVTIDHGHGVTSKYAHLKKYKVKVGDIVDVTTVIGQVGMSGRVTGPHLHFELSIFGERVNPKISSKLFMSFSEKSQLCQK